MHEKLVEAINRQARGEKKAAESRDEDRLLMRQNGLTLRAIAAISGGSVEGVRRSLAVNQRRCERRSAIERGDAAITEELPVRAQNALKSAGLTTPDEVAAALASGEFDRMSNVGKASLEAIHRWVEKHRMLQG